MKAIIPTGGSGTRMRPLTFSSNKHFIPIANKPLIFYPIETIANAGIKEVALTYNPGQLDNVKNVLGDGSKWGLKFSYVLQEKPAGLSNIFQVCEEYLAGESFVLHLGDNIFVDGIKDIVEQFERDKPNGLLFMIHHKDNKRLGVPYFDDQGNFTEYVEKPENPPNDFGIPGIYFFDHHVFECFKGEDAIKPSSRGELEIGAAYNLMTKHGYKVEAVEYKGKWMDPGKFDDWIEANGYILEKNLEEKNEGEIDSQSKIVGKVNIGKGTKIENSEINGPVIIGENVIVRNAKIGSGTSIADNCIIEDCSLENSVIMSGVKIVGVKEPISTSLIGSNSQIKGKNGTMKLFIGEKCEIEL